MAWLPRGSGAGRPQRLIISNIASIMSWAVLSDALFSSGGAADRTAAGERLVRRHGAACHAIDLTDSQPRPDAPALREL